MEIPHRELATAQAARLVLANLSKNLACPATTNKQLIEAAIQVFGIRWNLPVLRRIGSRALHRLLWQLRNSSLPANEYARVSSLFKEGCVDKAEFPLAWEDWRTLIERFNLDDDLPLAEWFRIIDACVKQGWKEPIHLAKLDSIALTAFSTAKSPPPIAVQLWKAAVLVFADAATGIITTLKGISENAELFLNKIKAASLTDSAVRKDVSKALRKLRLPKSFSDLGPTAKIQKLRIASVNKTKITNFSVPHQNTTH